MLLCWASPRATLLFPYGWWANWNSGWLVAFVSPCCPKLLNKTLTPASPPWPLVAADSTGKAVDSQAPPPLQVSLSCMLERCFIFFPGGDDSVREVIDFSSNNKWLKIANTPLCWFSSECPHIHRGPLQFATQPTCGKYLIHNVVVPACVSRWYLLCLHLSRGMYGRFVQCACSWSHVLRRFKIPNSAITWTWAAETCVIVHVLFWAQKVLALHSLWWLFYHCRVREVRSAIFNPGT